MRIRVTQSDIQRGVPQSAQSCPIARAAKRAFKRKVSVGSGWINVFSRNGIWIEHSIPRKATSFIKKFDAFRDVKPIEFEVIA